MSTGLEPTITLTKEDEWWIAHDTETGVISQGKTRIAALDNLDEAVALHTGEAGETVGTADQEAAVLEDLDIDPDEIQDNREGNSDLPEFMQ